MTLNMTVKQALIHGHEYQEQPVDAYRRNSNGTASIESLTAASIESLSDDEGRFESGSFRRRSLGSVSFDDGNMTNGSATSWKTRRSGKTESQEFKVGPSHRATIKNNINIQQLTINKLRYDAVGLVGRERETETLLSCFNRMMNENEVARKELVLIKGYSGAGKSMLSTCLEKPVLQTKRGLFVRGKFHVNARDRPYSAVADAFSSICSSIMNIYGPEGRDEVSIIDKVGKEIASDLGSEVQLLEKLIPGLAGILPFSKRSSRIEGENFDFEAGQERWKYSFRVLARILSLHFAPLAIVLDDLQWADVSSLQVIDFLISDALNPSPLMIIGTYRSNEVDDSHALAVSIQSLLDRQEKFQFHVTTLELGNLEMNDVDRILKQLLWMSDRDRTEGLAEICFRRTLGNPYFVIEFITMLEAEDLLSFNLGMLKWVWDERVVENETMTTANVVDLLDARMRKLPDDVQMVLQYASCLGTPFDVNLLSIIWAKHAISNSGSTPEQLITLLTVLEQGNFIEKCGKGLYRWVHDKVQEVALSLGDASQASFQFEIGSALFHALRDDGLELVLFDVVDLINKGHAKRRVDFAILNQRAAEKARKMSAFHSAAKYVASGISLLPRNAWSDHHDLTITLHTIGAEMSLALGDIVAMETYIDAVLSRRDCSIVDKFPLCMSKVYKLCTVDLKYEVSIDYCLEILKDLDYKLINNKTFIPMQAILSLMSTVKLAKKYTKDHYRNLKPMTDPKDKAAMLVAHRLTIACYLDPNPRNNFLLVIALTRMVQITIKRGVGHLSGPGFVLLGLLAVAALNDFDGAAFFCETALLLQGRTNSKYTKAITYFNAHSTVLAWTMPLASCLEPVSIAYTVGMQSGNTEQAMWALQVYNVWMPYMMGKPLGVILDQCSDVAFRSEEVKQHEQVTFLKVFWQMLLNLVGKSTETKKLKGDVLDCDTFRSKTALQDALFHLARLELLLFFGDYEAAAELALTRGDKYEKAAPAYFLGMLETFHRGVALYAMARKTNKRKYKKPAKQILKTITGWVEKGNPNVKHYMHLLLAEQACLDKKYETANTLYQQSYISAARTGRLHDAGLFLERYSDFLLVAMGDKENALYQKGASIRFYRDWGAEAKVAMLSSQRGSS
eukprot:scaffold6486_cov96-Cylindrotheca_fusiformis.AAC.5